MSSLLNMIPSWVHDLPLPVKIVALVIGVPALIIALNVLQQIVRVIQLELTNRYFLKTHRCPRSCSTIFPGLARRRATAWTRTSSCSTAAKR